MTFSCTTLLERLRSATSAFERVGGLETGGRAVLLMVSAHMYEATKMITGDFDDDISAAATAYFHQFYDPVVCELVQEDDVAFTTHHYLRILYEHYTDEIASLREGPLGKVLAQRDLAFPDARPPTPPRGRSIAGYWYDDVKDALKAGRLPAPHVEERNTVMSSDECVSDEVENESLWLGALKWLINIWGEQSVPMWQVLRDTITIRREAEAAGEDAVAAAVAAEADAVADALAAYEEAFERWRAFHAETLTIHFPLFRLFLVGIEDWLASFGEAAESMPIIDPLKDEVYLEVASTVAELRGEPYGVEIPAAQYWRVNPWTAPAQLPGSSGMPPFKTS